MANNIPLNQRERKQRMIKVGITAGLVVVGVVVLLSTCLLRKGYEVVFSTPEPTVDPRAAVVEAGVSDIGKCNRGYTMSHLPESKRQCDNMTKYSFQANSLPRWSSQRF
jgi:hypothetical protein